ncbi:cellulose biosynthesis protein BcsN [Ensifer sp. 4252]|uniref:cellulose biosynthesis protein BcsN n=1 Tax=Ensifer sp. 4252 TaxID=3373915 RepID=UPI003D1B48CF
MAGRFFSRRFDVSKDRSTIINRLLDVVSPTVVLAAGLLMSSCATHNDVGTPTNATIVPAENALILPPPGGPAVLNVVERRRTNAIEQDIYLYTSASTPGQNFLRAQFFGPMETRFDQQKSSGYVAVRSSEMMRQARRALPGVSLAQSSDFLQNNYGPFGYAYGRGRGDDACIFAWQQIRGAENHRSPLKGYGTIQIRFRYCAAGASENELLSPVYGYTIVGTFGDPAWNPYGAPPPLEAGIGRVGNPIYRKGQAPTDTRPVTVMAAPAPVRRVVRVEQPARRQPVAVPATANAVRLPQPDGAAKAGATVIVPLPACDAQAGGNCP